MYYECDFLWYSNFLEKLFTPPPPYFWHAVVTGSVGGAFQAALDLLTSSVSLRGNQAWPLLLQLLPYNRYLQVRQDFLLSWLIWINPASSLHDNSASLSSQVYFDASFFTWFVFNDLKLGELTKIRGIRNGGPCNILIYWDQ